MRKMTNSEKAQTAYTLVIFALIIAFCLGAAYVNAWIKDYEHQMMISHAPTEGVFQPYALFCALYGLSIALYAAIPTICLIIYKKRVAALDGKSLQDGTDYAEAYKKSAIEDEQTRWRELLREINGLKAEAVFLALFPIVICFLSGCVLNGFSLIAIPIAIVPMAYSSAFFFRSADGVADYGDYEITDKNYPELYSLLRSAADASGSDRRIRFYLGTDGFSVFEDYKQAWIKADALTLMYLTKDEIYQIVLHECAHVINSDTAFSRTCSSVESMFDPRNRFENIIYKLTFSRATYVISYCMLFRLSISVKKEIAADDIVRRKGNPQSFIDGDYKLMLLDKFESKYSEDLNEYIESNENITEHFNRFKFETLKKRLPEKKELFTSLLLKELPARNATHPTFKQRAETFGITRFDADKTETDENYLKEVDAAVDALDKEYAEAFKDVYSEMRKEYLENKEKISKFQSDKADGKQFSEDEKAEIIVIAFSSDRAKCRALCEEVLSENPDNVYANMYYGSILAEEYDPECVKYLYKAADGSFNFTETAMETIGRFAIETGDEELLERYRSEVVSRVQISMDDNGECELKKGDEILTSDIPEEELRNIFEILQSKGEDCIESIAHFMKRGKKENIYYFAFKFKKSSSVEKNSAAWHELWQYLDLRNDNRSYSILAYSKNMDARARKSGAQIKKYSA